MKIVTVVGARPQFIKASALSRAIQSVNQADNTRLEEVMVHTGQHFDDNMSAVFFSELELDEPKYNLGIAQCDHSEMTGKMLIGVGEVLNIEKPDMVLVYGDTNSTLAGALSAAKMNIPVVHVESGLRSYNRKMPEEVNRVLVDHISNWLFCPTEEAVLNLEKEGIDDGVYNVGDVMFDVTRYYEKKALKVVNLDKWGLQNSDYVLCTIHRAENTDDKQKLSNILDALAEIAKSVTVVFPVHPRTKLKIDEFGLSSALKTIAITEPLSYFEMLALESNSIAILTDSGGVQKEAFFHRKPCLTLREETEWVETVESGFNFLCGSNQAKILKHWRFASTAKMNWDVELYGDGTASNQIVQKMLEII